MIYEVQIPNGRVLEIEGPEGASNDDLIAVAQEHYEASMRSAKQAVENDAVTRGARSFASDMPFVEQFAAGMGAAPVNLWRGVKQKLGIGDQTQLQREIDEARRLEAPLMRTAGGVTGNIAGSAVMFAPAAAIPFVNTLAGSAALGAATGALQPTVTGESEIPNALMGGVLGLGGQALGNTLRFLARPIKDAATAEAKNLANAAMREGIPLSAGQVTASRPLQLAESVMESLPLTSNPAMAAREARQSAYNRAVLAKVGIDANKADAGMLVERLKSLGTQIRSIANENSLSFYAGKNPLIGELDKILTEAEKRGAEASGQIRSVVMNIVGEIDPRGYMGGANYQAWRDSLRPLAKAGGQDSHFYGQIRRALDDAFAEQVSDTTKLAWDHANRQYASLKTIIDAMGQAGANTKAGNISPAALEGALTRSIGREGKALGRGDLNELVAIGRQFISEGLPDSFTAPRLTMINLLSGNLGAMGLGAGAGYAAGGPEGAAYGAMLGTGAKLLAPKIVQSLMNSAAGQEYLKRGLLAMSPRQAALLTGTTRTGALSLSPWMMSQ